MPEKANELPKVLKKEFNDVLSLTESSLRKIWGSKEDEIWKQYLRGKK